MKRIIIYHDDADGRCAAAIAGRLSQNKELSPSMPADPLGVVYLPMQYGDPVAWDNFDGFKKDNDSFWLVDFSLNPIDMERMADIVGLNFFWFDHHKTAVDNLKALNKFLPGTRDTEKAACRLVWENVHPGKKIPAAVQYISDRDMWLFVLGNATHYFYELYLSEPNTHPDSCVWNKWLSDTSIGIDLLRGKDMHDTRIRVLKTYAERLGTDDKIFGWPDRTCLTLNFPGSGDMGQIGKDMGYAMVHCYVEEVRVGRLTRIHSLYSDVLDVSEIAKSFGGGGHKGAAGWVEIL